MSEKITDKDKQGLEVMIRLIEKRLNEIKGSDKYKSEEAILKDYLEGYSALRDGKDCEGYKIGKQVEGKA